MGVKSPLWFPEPFFPLQTVAGVLQIEGWRLLPGGEESWAAMAFHLGKEETSTEAWQCPLILVSSCFLVPGKSHYPQFSVSPSTVPSRKSLKSAFEIHSVLAISERAVGLGCWTNSDCIKNRYGKEHALYALSRCLYPGCGLILTLFYEADIAAPVLKMRMPYLEVQGILHDVEKTCCEYMSRTEF